MDEYHKVLLIEDSTAFASMLTQLIDISHGYSVEVCSDLKSAKATIAANPNHYFAAIVDLHLPDAPNGEAVDEVVSHKIPTIVFTGVDGVVEEEDLWDKGIADYAHKSGAHSLEYIVWVIHRIYQNRQVGILVVDDSAVARKGTVKLLNRQNFKTYTAASGEEALELIEEYEDIHVAIIDCYMDQMDGFELCMAIRTKKTKEELEIIGMSGRGGQALSARFIKSGANDFLVKPFVPEELLCRVNHSADRIQQYCQLRELNKLKNHLLGTAAHDIRGPIAAIKTAANLIKKPKTTPERAEFLIDLIRTNCTDMLSLLEDLLDVSALENGESELNLKDSDLSELVKERINLYVLEAEGKNIAIETEIESGPLRKVDPLKFKQVVDNLVSNAIKYSPSDSAIAVKLIFDERLITLAIEDAGPGIPMQEQSELFKPFALLSTDVTANEPRRGLGLSIAKSIMLAHGGELSYKCDKDKPSTFFAELPISDG